MSNQVRTNTAPNIAEQIAPLDSSCVAKIINSSETERAGTPLHQHFFAELCRRAWMAVKNDFGNDPIVHVPDELKNHQLVQRALKINEGVVEYRDGVPLSLGPSGLGLFYGNESQNPTVKAFVDLLVEAGGDPTLQLAIASVWSYGAIHGTDGITSKDVKWSDDQSTQRMIEQLLRKCSRVRISWEFMSDVRAELKLQQSLETEAQRRNVAMKQGVTYATADGTRHTAASLLKAELLMLEKNKTLNEAEQLQANLEREERVTMAYIRKAQEAFFNRVREANPDLSVVEGFKVETKLKLPQWVIAELPTVFSGASTAAATIVGTREKVDGQLAELAKELRIALERIDHKNSTKFVEDFDRAQHEGGAIGKSRLALLVELDATQASDPKMDKLRSEARCLVVGENGASFLVADNSSDWLYLLSRENLGPLANEGGGLLTLSAAFERWKERLAAGDDSVQLPAWFETAAPTVNSELQGLLDHLLTVKTACQPTFDDAGFANPQKGASELLASQKVLVPQEAYEVFSLGSEDPAAKHTLSQLGLRLDESIGRPIPWLKHQPNQTEVQALRAQAKEQRRNALKGGSALVADFYEKNQGSIGAVADFVVAQVAGYENSDKVVELNEFLTLRREFDTLAEKRGQLSRADQQGWGERYLQIQEDILEVENRCRDGLKALFPELKLSDTVEIRPDMLRVDGQKEVSGPVLFNFADSVALSMAEGLIRGIASARHLQKTVGDLNEHRESAIPKIDRVFNQGIR